jgi:HK97 family phage major capsid protein
LADAPQLQSTVDGELRYGVAIEEESEMLFGDGTGQHLFGIVPQASIYETSRDKAGDTMFDTLVHAIAQTQLALLPATGIVLNEDDLEALKTIKDADGRYIGGGPFGPAINSIWGRPTVGTPVMPVGTFLVGAFFDGAQIFDREEVNVMIATENEDDFTRNLCTILCEERLAFAVKRPQSFVSGSFPQVSG